MAITKLVTAHALMCLEDNGFHYELIEGNLERVWPATPEHGWIAAQLGWYLSGWSAANGLGEIFSRAGYFFGHRPDTVLGPDISFLRANRLPPVDTWRAYSEVVPDFVVEVISPSERRAHVDRKITIYLAAGVRLVWFVDPRRRTVTVYAPDQEPRVLYETDELDSGDVLPGFRVSITSLFPPGGSQA